MAYHSRISPSKLESAALCAGMVNATAHIVRLPNEFAAEGTMLHDIAATSLELDVEPFDFVGQHRVVDGFKFEVTDDLVECMVEGLDWAREQPGELFVERRVLLDPHMPGQSGVTDIAIVHETPEFVRVTIMDWKFGIGILVPVVGNYQIRAYGIGFYETVLKPLGVIPDEWVFIIEQPRAPGGSRFYAPWVITHDELMSFASVMRRIQEAADDPNAPRVAGKKQCGFCEAKMQPGGCPTYEKFMVQLITESLDGTDTATLSAEHRSFLVMHQDMVKTWFSNLVASTTVDAVAGRPTPGLKAIEGNQGRRKWGDQEFVQEVLIDILDEDAFNKKLISPTQAEKVLKPGRKRSGHPATWKALQKVITRDAALPILVLESDPRPAMKSVDDKFDDNEDELI